MTTAADVHFCGPCQRLAGVTTTYTYLRREGLTGLTRVTVYTLDCGHRFTQEPYS